MRPVIIGAASGFLAAQVLRDTEVARWTANFPYRVIGEAEIGLVAGGVGHLVQRRVDGQTHEKVLEPTTDLLWSMAGGLAGYLAHQMIF